MTALFLRNCAGVTDAAVLGLARLDALTEVDLTGTAVSPEGVAKLREALPQCRLVSSHGTREPKK